MTTIRTAEQYRQAILSALEGSDRALIQDALYDVDEFLRSERLEAGDGLAEEELVERAIERFGAPEEVASSYRQTEHQVARALATPPLAERLGVGIFGVLVDPRAYGALCLMLISLVTGILYFTWVAVGISLSIGLAILIIGIPFVILFAVSSRALGLMEGRLLEGLLGVRMPRRPPPGPTETGWLARVKYWVTDPRTWSTLLYMLLALPLGIVSFTIAIVMLSLALGFVAAPFGQLFWDQAVIHIGDFEWHPPWWTFPFFWVTAFLLELVLLHVAKAFGKLRVWLARGLLVG